mgnify:CR=1 FL=1
MSWKILENENKFSQDLGKFFGLVLKCYGKVLDSMMVFSENKSKFSLKARNLLLYSKNTYI